MARRSGSWFSGCRLRRRGPRCCLLQALGCLRRCGRGREYNSAEVPERTLRSVYFPPFRAALDAGAGTVMTALNTVNGIPATANPFTLGRVLRGEWQFDGLVVSDYKAVKNLIAHGMASNEREAASLAILAGVDMEEESDLFRTRWGRSGEEWRGSAGAGRRGRPPCAPAQVPTGPLRPPLQRRAARARVCCPRNIWPLRP